MYLKDRLVCPICKGKLKKESKKFLCLSCKEDFPIVNNIPILIDEKNSVFSKEDFTSNKETFFISKTSKLDFFKKFIPKISLNIYSKKNFKKIGFLLKKIDSPNVLVIGGSIDGDGFSELRKFKKINFIESDVSYGKNTKIILDSHSVPFMNETFDAVIVQAVLEHVLDPVQCVSEIHRVLKKDGLVYSEIPFIQQVHGGKYDFTRFTYLGHINLFKNFKLIFSGPTCGPGMALSWTYVHFLLSFSSNNIYRSVMFAFGSLTSFFFKYFDYYLIKKKSSYGASSGNFYIGRKSNSTLTPKELFKFYKK